MMTETKKPSVFIQYNSLFVGKYQIYRSDWGFDFIRWNTSLKHILEWSIRLGWLGIHKHVTRNTK